MTNEKILETDFGSRAKPNVADVIQQELSLYFRALCVLEENVQKLCTNITSDFEKGCNLRAFDIECDIRNNIKLVNSIKRDIVQKGILISTEITEKEAKIKELCNTYFPKEFDF